MTKTFSGREFMDFCQHNQRGEVVILSVTTTTPGIYLVKYDKAVPAHAYALPAPPDEPVEVKPPEPLPARPEPILTPEDDILPKAQCSSGTSQSRPDSARPVKVIASAGQLTHRNAVAGGGKVAEKHKSATGAPASISAVMAICGGCGASHPAGEVCPVCSAMQRCAEQFRRDRRNNELKRRFGVLTLA